MCGARGSRLKLTSLIQYTISAALCIYNNNNNNNNNLIDKVFTNRVDLYVASCFKSLIKTKHSAILIASRGDQDFSFSKRYSVTLYDFRTQHIDRLRYALGTFDWLSITSCYDVDLAYDSCLYVVQFLIAKCVPQR